MSTVTVAYVGQKESETDCVAGTGLTWEGAGSVHEVPLEAWEKMANHPDVWALVESDAQSLGLSDVMPESADDAGDQFDAMDDDALREFAGAHSIRVHHKQRGDTLRAVIRQALDAKE